MDDRTASEVSRLTLPLIARKGYEFSHILQGL
nr:MAG TPA: hypothetical protein [Caudoviricetes sp.]